MSISFSVGGRSAPPSKAQQAALLEQAMRLHQQGQLAQANQIYNTLLQANPRNAGALHMLGLLAYQTGHLQPAFDLMGQAIAAYPKDPAPYVNRGLVLTALQRHEEALAHYDQALALNAGLTQAHVNRGGTLAELGRLEDAVQSYDRAIAQQPGFAPAHNNKGNALRKLGRLDDAQAAYTQALTLDARYTDACHNLATLHAEAGRTDDALRYFDQVLALQPQHAGAQNGKGSLLAQQERHEEAVAHFNAAIAANPQLATAHKHLGQSLYALRRHAQAAQALQQALQGLPGDADTLSLRALALLEAGQYTESLAAHNEALQAAPQDPRLFYNRANVYVRLNQPEKALPDYVQVQTLDEDATYALGFVAHYRLKTCDWSHLADDLQQCERSLRAGRIDVRPFVALSLWDSPELQLQSARSLVNEKYPETNTLGPLPSQRAPGKIRVGYFSADFHSHATAALMAELFEVHDRSQFEWIAFSFGPPSNDTMRQRVAAAFDQFIDVQDCSDIDIARRARAEGIDIAVDLKGFTQDHRFGIFAHRAAPVQVSYLGYPGTTGAPYMDYVIADRMVLPPEGVPFFTEAPVYLPHSYQVNDAHRPISDRIFTRAEVGLPETGFVFCSFNNNYKIHPATFDGWMRILQAVPGSVLWLYEENASVAAHLRQEAAARGVDGQRLVFAPRMPAPDHLARHRLADLFLDTVPVNAHTTASDALWAGLPVLTLAGQSFAARVAASLLHAAGLPNLVTHSQADYEALAIALAQDNARLMQLRTRVQTAARQSPLFNARLLARHIEAAYLQMHTRHQQGLPPQTLDIPA